MTHLTTEQIAAVTDHLDGLANIRAINALYREQDESHKWPISGEFDATERAIRKARQFRRDSGAVYGYEYAALIDSILSDIVNGSE